MISLIQGKVIGNNSGQVSILTAGGVGYVVYCSLAGLKDWQVGNDVSVMTYLAVRENALELYGFINDSERGLFLRLIQVSGIGPKTALHILSLGSVDEISGAIARGDLVYLTKVSGIGKKTAERIVVELKDKILLVDGGNSDSAPEGVLGDVVEGLIALGYQASEAREVIKKIDSVGKSTEQILKEALQNIK